MLIATFRLPTARLHQAMRSTDHAAPFMSRWSAVIDAFRSAMFRREVVPSGTLLYHSPAVFLDRGHLRFGNFIPLALLMLSGWSLMRIASLTLRVYRWESRSIDFTSSQSHAIWCTSWCVSSKGFCIFLGKVFSEHIISQNIAANQMKLHVLQLLNKMSVV